MSKNVESQEEIKERRRKYYLNNKEMLLEKQRLRYKNNPDVRERVMTAQQKYWNKPGVRKKRNQKSLEKYHSDIAKIRKEREQQNENPLILVEPETIIAIHDDILRNDKDRLTKRFLEKLIYKD